MRSMRTSRLRSAPNRETAPETWPTARSGRPVASARGDFRRQTDVFVLIRKGLAPRSVCLLLKVKSTRLDSKDRLFFAGRDGGIHASAGGL